MTLSSTSTPYLPTRRGVKVRMSNRRLSFSRGEDLRHIVDRAPFPQVNGVMMGITETSVQVGTVPHPCDTNCQVGLVCTTTSQSSDYLTPIIYLFVCLTFWVCTVRLLSPSLRPDFSSSFALCPKVGGVYGTRNRKKTFHESTQSTR